DAPIVVPSPLPRRVISPWAVGILALLLVGVALGVLLWTSEAPPGERSSPPERLREHRAAAEEALRQGDYDRLARACAEALALDDRQPGLLSPGERRHLRQLGAQAAVLRDLLFESLPEVLRTAPGVPDAVWAAEFERRYRGKAVVFDALMHRDAAGEYHLDYALFTREGEVRVLWHEVELFRRLPLEEPRRLIFGARLASASRDATGRWQVRLQPGGTVLFTDPEMFTGTTLPPADDETRAVLRRQAEWLAEIGQ
ncbi:MAG TPA: hypothetical protein VIL46_13745, partial [Gemmataceae bacterium]